MLYRFLHLFFFCLFIAPWRMAADLPPSNDFEYLGENLLPAQRAIAGLRPTGSDGMARALKDGRGLQLESRNPGSKATFSLPIAVEPGVEYLFRATVRSSDAVVARLGKLSMAYHDQGQWQRVAGLYRATDDPTGATLRLDLQSLDPARPASAEIRELSLIRVRRPASIGRHPFSGSTELVKNGAPNAAIVIPADAETYAALASSIRAAVREKTGVELPILSDREATGADYPVLKPALRDKNLILLGRLGNNRAFWPAYNRFLTAVDGFYPGGDGYVVQTAANVAHHGENHLVIGGTSDAGVRRGVEPFLDIVASANWDGKTLRLPWLLQTDLQGDCLAFFKHDDAQWREKPESPLLPKPAPGYGNVIRWYRNAMGYYWSGDEAYRKRADHYLSLLLQERAYTHHYIAEFFVRTFNMLDESGVLPPGQVRAVDALLLENFLDVMTVGDLHWMTTFTPPYGRIHLGSRHQIDAWMSDYMLAAFIADRLTPEGGLKELVDFRRTEKGRALTDFVTHRNNPNLPENSGAEAYEEINASFFRFALDHDLYREFFGSGNARKALSLERINQVTGNLAYPTWSRDTRLLLGIVTSLTRDPELHWLWSHLPETIRPTGYFQNRYLGNLRRYTPDADLPQTVPQQGVGITFTPNPVENAPFQINADNYGFTAIREGFEPEDDYLAFHGLDDGSPAGALVALISRGTTWLGKGLRDGSGSRFSANTATAVRIDQPSDETFRNDISHALWNADLPTGQALRFHQKLSQGVEWTRDAIRIGRGRFIFRDHFTAQEEGTYLLGVGWHLNLRGRREADGYRFSVSGKELRLHTGGDGFSLVEMETGKLAGQSLRNQSVRHFKKGESAVAYTVMEVAPARAGTFRPVALADREHLLLGEGPNRVALDWSGDFPATPKAALVISTPERTGIYHGVSPESGQRLSFLLPAKDQPKSREDAITRAVAALNPPAPESSADAGSSHLAVRDATGEWTAKWRYGGFLKPSAVTGYQVINDRVIDFGETLLLAEIRAKPLNVSPQRLPEKILYSTAGPGAEDWKPVRGKRQWRPGVRTSNYGEAHPVAKQDETLLLDPPVAARYVKADSPESLLFYSDSRREARHPLKLESGDFLGRGEPQTLAASAVFPESGRSTRSDDLSVALLDARGKAIFQKDLSGPVQAIRLLDRKGNGKKELFILYANGTLEMDALDGTPQATADLYRMHQAFAARYSEHKTRQPPGGYVLPFSVGLWRPDTDGQRGIIISRYGGFTFLKPDLSFEGVLNVSGGFGTPGLLATGIDFGNGQEEQVVVERQRLWQLGGSGKPTVRDPGGSQFWEQTYELLKSTFDQASESAPISGMPILRYEPLFGVTEHPRYLLLARGTSLTLYDAKKRVFRYRWNSPAPLKGVAILEQSRDRLRLLVSTADFLLWEMDWKNGLEGEPSFSAGMLDAPIVSISEATGGTAFLAGPEGLYRFTDAAGLEQIARGAFQSVNLPSDDPETVVAATEKGEITRFQKTPKNNLKPKVPTRSRPLPP
ncbi:MAG TPA: hypothetical protein VNQ90_01435 [Chthoniobacteraceae bacterium]|nr:hypothetical protein [Chthoniobacteraceae bacterium]